MSGLKSVEKNKRVSKGTEFEAESSRSGCESSVQGREGCGSGGGSEREAK